MIFSKLLLLPIAKRICSGVRLCATVGSVKLRVSKQPLEQPSRERKSQKAGGDASLPHPTKEPA